MKKVIQLFAITAASFSSIGIVFADSINATIVAGHPPVFRWVKHLENTFIPAANNELDGTQYTFTWSQHYGGSLAKVGSVLEATEEGLAEVGYVSTLFESSKLPLQNVTYFTPFVSNDVTEISSLIDSLNHSNKDMINEWHSNGVEYLGGATGIDEYLLMTRFPLASMDDLASKKIAAPGPAVNWLEGTGAIAVSGDLTRYYNELKAGVYDGVIVFATAAVPSKLYEVAPYISKVGFGAQYAGSIVANKDWFDSQPKEVQLALKSAANAQRIAYHQDLTQAIESSMNLMVENGAVVSTINSQFQQSWVNGMDNVALKWAAHLDQQGKAGTQVLKTYLDTMRENGVQPARNWDQE
ncbi:C4-dicarboxylate ABC transporter permease [Vibrio aquaticus]|uniref:C4-dicarboxylate ABC transporter permease n=1 Tax=Vibrio aquaticus TaxID=2496559 RepID=A0A3S0PR68_9VIBR|nr:C4-dicarboxylate TRAP transporter substrate-binding protein [Vibrio aquaticus]RTZ17792.1 C4-dicarboxylate ABC transporter permease [Vibrio aquaticus]